ncbi:hypothetical protein L6164_028806 [Bauhinia variegata]|uniref:Uncharacterized protein n=1 Tax=Bauhinia variegata TaxID=167791 RepID=A0ACB9L6T8_BAUVA|nr:hypothetical protein L6164_028806 [Bauhinia variegata]
MVDSVAAGVQYDNEGGGDLSKGSLGWAIDTHFGSLEALIQKANAEGAALQGSEWMKALKQRPTLSKKQV